MPVSHRALLPALLLAVLTLLSAGRATPDARAATDITGRLASPGMVAVAVDRGGRAVTAPVGADGSFALRPTARIVTLHLIQPALDKYVGVVVVGSTRRPIVGIRSGAKLTRLHRRSSGVWRAQAAAGSGDASMSLSSSTKRVRRDGGLAKAAARAAFRRSRAASAVPAASLSAPTASAVLPPAAGTHARAEAAAPASPGAPVVPAASPVGDQPAITASPAATQRDPVATRIADLRMLNYGPSTHAWSAMWTDWRPSELDADFAKIAALNANAVRLAVMPWVTGYPTPSATMLDRLHQAIALAAGHGLRVQLTLFDWWGSWSDIAGSRAWAHAVLDGLAGDDRVAFIELKNEVDAASLEQMAWSRQLMPFVRTEAKGIPVTISVSSSSGLSGLRKLRDTLGDAQPDFYDLHYYNGEAASLAYATFAAARDLVAPRPLYVGETGFSLKTPVVGVPDTASAREAYQAQYLKVVVGAARAAGIPAPAIWTLNDFAPGGIPTNSSTSQSPAEYAYGLFRVDGTERPAAAVVRQLFGSAGVAPFKEDFETQGVSDGNGAELPAGWGQALSDDGSFTLDAGTAHSGSASARLARTGGSSSGYPAFTIVPDVATRPGKAYRATVWCKGAASTGTSQVAIAWFDDRARYLGSSQSSALPAGSSGWTLLQAQGTAPASAAYPQIYLKSGNNAGAVWFDDVTFGAVS